MPDNPTLQKQIQQMLAERDQPLQAWIAAAKEQIEGHDELLLDLERKLADFHGRPSGKGRGSPFAELITKEAIRAVASGAPSSGRMELPNLSLKTLTSIQGGDSSGSFPNQEQRYSAFVGLPYRPLTLLQVLQTQPVTTNTFEFVRVDSETANPSHADYQGDEGDPKLEDDAEFDSLQQVFIPTIASWMRASRQVLSDNPGLQMFLDALFQFRVLNKLEREVVRGTGGAKEITGLATAATSFVSTFDQPPDRIGEAAATLDGLGWTPGLVIMNPFDWQDIRSERATGDGQYVAGGWAAPAQPSMWSLPVVTTSSLAEGEALVMDLMAALLLDRELPQVLISTEDGSNFTRNLVTILGEVRAGLAILAPTALLSVDVSPQSS